MAELHVEPKKHASGSVPWLWIVVGLIVAAVVIYFLVARNNTNNNNAQPANTTGAVEQQRLRPTVVNEVGNQKATEFSYHVITL